MENNKAEKDSGVKCSCLNWVDREALLSRKLKIRKKALWLSEEENFQTEQGID